MNEEALVLLKEAFKRSLREHLGSIEEKPVVELQAWSLALLELATDVRLFQLSLEDEIKQGRLLD